MAITDQIVSAAQEYGVDPSLAIEVATAESGLDENAVSPTGAVGVFQLEPGTAAMLGVDPTDVAQNIDGGVRYLAQMLAQFSGNVEAALAAYNWGPSNVAKAIANAGSSWLSLAPSETQNYVKKILAALGEWTATPAAPAASPGGGAGSFPIIGIADVPALWQAIGPTGRLAVYVGGGAIALALAAALLF